MEKAQQQQQYQQTIPQQPDPIYKQPKSAFDRAVTQVQDATSKLDGEVSRGWLFGLFDCFAPIDLCCLSFWCPCYVFGRTHERNTTGNPDAQGFNVMCAAWYGASCFAAQGVVQFLQRSQTRDKHNIDGTPLGDAFVSCCCTCCTIIQEEKESIVRVTGLDPKTGLAYQYQPVTGMNYNH